MFQMPTLNELAERSRLAFRRNLKGSDAWVWPNNVYASAKVIAGMVFENFGFQDYVKRMIFAHTAPDIETLLMHGEEYGIARKPAAPASGTANFVATAATVVASNTVLERADGVRYLVVAGGELTGAGTLSVPIVAISDGAIANALASTPLAIISGVTGIGASTVTAAVGADGVILGADVEGIESYRSRILFRKRNPPHGGAPADYVMWALQVSGVTRVFVERKWNGGGTVRVYVLMDDAFPNGIPDAAAVARVQDYIDTVCPAGAIVTVAAPVEIPIDVTINNLIPNTTDVQNAVRAELADTFYRRGRVSGIDTGHSGMPFLATPESFSRSWLWQAVADASGEDRHVLLLPSADVTIPTGGIAVPGTISIV